MARQQQTSFFQQVEGAADHHRLRRCCSASSCTWRRRSSCSRSSYTTFLSTLPPLILLAVGLTFVIGAGEIDLCFPADSSPSPASSSRSCSRTVTTLSRSARGLARLAAGRSSSGSGGSPSPLLVGFINGVLVAKIGIPSFIATLGTQFFWYGMATVLSGGKSYALRGAEESSVWTGARRPALRQFQFGVGAAAPDPGAVDGADRHLPVVHPQPPPLRRAHPVHRRFERRVARRRHRCRAREDQALHPDGRRWPPSPRSC